MSDSENIIELPNREIVKAEAGQWIARCDTRALSEAEQAELRAWLQRSPVHREEFERIAGVWRELDRLDDLNYLGEAGEQAARTVSGLVGRRLVLTGLAASSVLAVGSFALFQAATRHTRVQDAAFETAVGEQRTATLVDGSVVILNTDSAVEVSYTPQTRDIRLLRGEALFEVRRDASRPFSVYAGEGVVRAVGTAFSVYLRERQAVEVTVSHGRVELLSQPMELADNEAQDAAGKPKPLVELRAGENAVFRETSLERLDALPKAELDRKLSWRRGLLAFAGEPLSEVLAEVGRYTNYRIEIADPGLGALPIGGYFKVGEVDSLLRALEQSFDISVERLEENRVRLHRKA